jgi:hypothetical protein
MQANAERAAPKTPGLLLETAADTFPDSGH